MRSAVYRNKSIEIPYVGYEHEEVRPSDFTSARNPFSQQTMGSWFSDVTGINLDFFSAAEQLANQIAITLKGVGDAISNINWQVLGNNIAQVSSVVANVMVQLNPAYLYYQGFSTNPLTAHAFKELDNLSGGFLTDVTNVSTLPARVIRGDAILKEECIRDAILGIKVAIVVLSAGAATTVVSESSGQLSRGTLGQTTLGKNLLTIGAAAGLSALSGGSISNAVVKSGEAVGLQAAQGEVVKKSPLGQTELGRIGIGAGFAAGGGEITGEGATSGLSSFGKSTAIAEGARLAPGPLSPISGKLAGAVYSQIGQTSFAPSTGPDSSSSSGIDLSDLPGQIVDTVKQIPGRIADAFSNISISAPSLSAPDISMPDISGPSFSLPEINLGQLPPIRLPGGLLKLPISRTKKMIGTRKGYRYLFEDGTSVDIAEEFEIWPFIIGIGLVYAFGREMHTS